MKTSSWVKVVAASFICASALQAQAATYYWDDGSVTVDGASGGGTGTWTVGAAGWEDGSTAVNWANSNDAVFGGTAGTLTLGGAITAGSITFNTAGYLLDTGANALTASTLAGSGNFTKFGTGILTLSGASGYTGAMTINGGRLTLTSSATLTSGTGITVNGGTSASVGSYPYNYTGIRNGMLVLNKTGDNLGSQTVTLNNAGLMYNSPAGGSDTGTVQNVNAASGHNEFMAAPAGGVTGDTLAITSLTVAANSTALFRSIYGTLGGSGDNGRITVTTLNGSALANTNGILGGWAYAISGTGITGMAFAAKAATTTDIIAATPDKNNSSVALSTGVSTENWLANSGTDANRTITANTTINSLIEEADVKINSGATLTLESGGLIFRANNFWMQSTSGTGYLTSGTAKNLYVHAETGTDQQIKVIVKDGASGALTLVKAGTGTLKMGALNTHTGGTIINQGTLQTITTSFGLSTMGTGAITINGGGTLQAAAAHTLGWNAGTWNNITINDGGTFAIGVNDNYIGNLTLNDNASITGNSANYVGLATGTVSYTGSVASKQATISSRLSLASPSGNANATFTVNGSNPNGDLVVSGIVQSGGSLTKAGTGILALSGVNTYSGNTTISAGTLLISGSGQLGSGSYAGTINNSGTLAYSSSANQTLSGAISNSGALTKSGSGTLTLSTSNSYTGATTINGGVLNVTGSLASGSAVALNGGTLRGTGTVGGTVTVATGGAITGGDGTTGTLTLGNLTYNGNGSISIGTLSNYTSASAVSITGTLNPNGNTITLNLPTGSASAGTFHLLGTTYNSLTGIALGTIPTLSSRQSGGLSATSSYIDYVITGVNPYWTGAQSSEWSTATIAGSKNWALPGNGTTDYLAGDIVLFDDNATTTTADIATDVSPTSVTFNNTSKNYTLTGAAGIAGSTGLAKSGTGTLTISAANSFTGATSISAGVVNIQSAVALGGTGAGTTVSSGAALEIQGGITVGAEALSLNGSGVSSGGALRNISGSNTYGGAVTLAGASRINSDAGTLTLTGGIANGGFGLTVGGAGDTTVSTGVISGGGSLTKDGNGTLTLTGSNTYSGGTTVGGGALVVSGTSSATGTITINNGGTLTFGAATGDWWDIGAANGITINSGGTLTVTTGALYRNAGGDAYANNAVVTVKGTLNLKNFTYGGDGSLGGLRDYGNARVLDGGVINVTGNTQSSGNDFNVTNGSSGTFNMTTSGQTLTLSGNGNSNIAIGGALTIGGAGNITVSEVIQDNTGAGSIIKTGGGTLTFTVANTYTGATTVNNGTLVVSNYLRGTSGMTVNSGATLELGAINMFTTGHGSAMDNAKVLTANGGTLLMNGSMDSRIGNVTLTNGGTWTSNRGLTAYDVLLADTSTGAATVTVSGTGAATMNGTGGIHLSGVQNFNVADVTGSSATDLTVSMVLGSQGLAGGAAGGITKTGLGTMVLSGQNTYTGGTTVNQGTLTTSTTNGTANGAVGAGNVTVNSGGTIVVNGDNSFVGQTTSGSRTITINSGGLVTTSGSSSHLNAVVMNGGTLSATTPNALYGNWNIDFGVSTGGLGTTSTISGGNATLNQTGGTVMNVGTGDTLNISTVLAHLTGGGDTGLTKQGSGTLNLSGSNSYTGATTVSQGTLALSGTGSIAGSLTIDVASGATLDVSALSGWTLDGSQTLKGNGTVAGNATINGTVAPGNSIGTLTINDDLVFAGTYEIELGAANGTAGTDNDNITGVNNLTINGGALSLFGVAGFGTPVLGDKWLILSYTGTPTFNSAPSFTVDPSAALSPGWSYGLDTTTAGSVYLTVIPEPGTAGVVATFLVAALLRKRRFG